MKILVTGGAGFIGSNLVDKLVENGDEVSVIDNLSTGFEKNINPKAKFNKLNILNPYLKDIFRKEDFDVIYQLAAQIDLRKSVANPLNDFEENVAGSMNILELARKCNVKKFIFSSTGGAIYGDTELRPTKEDHPVNACSPYGINKAVVEKYLDYYNKMYGLNGVSLRYSNVFGPRQNPNGEAGVVAIFLKKMLKHEKPVIFGDGTQTRDYVFVDDVVNANILALGLPSGIYNVGTGIETDVNELFNNINSFFDYRFEKVYGPAKPGEQKTSCLDYSKIKDCSWCPKTDLKKGLEKTYEWFKNEY